jgi:hypothetical protein
MTNWRIYKRSGCSCYKEKEADARSLEKFISGYINKIRNPMQKSKSFFCFAKKVL